ncbi:BON domain-containing protein [Bordetella sp. 2513F-2]
MKALLNCAAALAAGAAAMYYLDPESGARRRALVRDKVSAGRHQVERRARARTRYVADRIHGAAARLQGGREVESDAQLEGRVRSRLGRMVSRAGAIHVTAAEGCITLEGSILADEHERLVSAVAAMDGVTAVDDRLTVHDAPGRNPALQGDGSVRAGSVH